MSAVLKEFIIALTISAVAVTVTVAVTFSVVFGLQEDIGS